MSAIEWLLIVLAMTRFLAPIPGQSPPAPEKSPEAVLARFCKMDAEGERLTPEGWRKAADLFVRPAAASKEGAIFVIKSYFVNGPVTKGNKAEFFVEYLRWAELDSTGRLIPSVPHLPGAPILVRAVYKAVETKQWWEVAPDGKTLREASGDPQWRIETFQPTQWITVDAAIRYVNDLHEKSKDPIIKQNANRTLAVLRQLQ
ncbi:MAG: hypothetical protein ACRD5G_07765 [Candidatus Acidiferrales bacterium]